MDLKAIRIRLEELFQYQFGEKPLEIVGLPQSGSNRKYFRLLGDKATAIGTYNTDKEENKAFYYLADHLKSSGVNVPSLYQKDECNGIYLQEDLGNVSLLDYVEANRSDKSKMLEIYKKVILQMPLIQFKAAQYMDYSICYPSEKFDAQSIQWDLNYFKYMFLKLAHQPFNEQLLEEDFQSLKNFLLEAPSEYFMFRDFQSRNIMVKDGEVYFIDFQGGREGALQYDLASLLYESKIGLTQEFREEILGFYQETFARYSFYSEEKFRYYFPAFVLVRLLQAFGAYGYRGLFEKKALFVQSIEKGLDNLKWAIEQPIIKKNFPYLCGLVLSMIDLKKRFVLPQTKEGLTVTISSFSYRNGYPNDWSGNGGGFIFDCRNLPNPGRVEKYRGYTGRDEIVSEYLEKENEVGDFVKRTTEIVQVAVEKYQNRGFTHLSVGFGCTGGQHRSVYSAEYLYRQLKLNHKLNLRLVHRELKIEEVHEQNNV